jgi:hypothetical protein
MSVGLVAHVAARPASAAEWMHLAAGSKTRQTGLFTDALEFLLRHVVAQANCHAARITTPA